MIATNNNIITDLKALGRMNQVPSCASSLIALNSSHSAPEASRGLFAQSFDLLSSDLSSQGLGMFAQGLGSLRLDSNLRFGARSIVPIRRECS